MKDFAIGDVVTIRDFDDMAEEFDTGGGYADIGGPPGCYAFISDMKKYCGKNFTIADVNQDNSPTAIITEPWYDLLDDNRSILNYYFHDWMFEESKDSADEVLVDPAYQIDFLLT